MKKLITILTSLFLVLGTGCSSNNSSSTSDDMLSQIKEKGQITIAMEGTWSPWTYHNENDELVGFDVEVGKLIAEGLGVEAVFVEGEWDGLLAGVQAGRYDVLINGCGVTEERSEVFSFTDPYVYDQIAIIVDEDSDITSFEDLKDKSTANTISSTYAEIAEQFGATVTGVDDLNQTLELLKNKRIDATLNSIVTYYDYKEAHPESTFKVACVYEEHQPIAIPVKKDESSKTLVEAINEILKELNESGKLKELSLEYFKVDLTEK